MPIVFTFSMPCSLFKPCALTRPELVLNPQTEATFSVAFKTAMPAFMNDCDSCDLSADELVTIINSTCTTILDSIAPLKTKRKKPVSEPWLNDATRVVRRVCRRAERKWKKDHLHVSLEILRDCLCSYQKAVKLAKEQYICNVVSNNCHRP